MATMYGTVSTPGEMALVVANDELQARDRVFDRIAKQCQLQGLVRSGEAIVTKGEITFPAIGSSVQAISADFAGAAGGIFGISSWTELWAFRYEGHIRLWEELTPIPNRRSLRIVDSYAGFTGDSPILEPMWSRALAGERIHDTLPTTATASCGRISIRARRRSGTLGWAIRPRWTSTTRSSVRRCGRGRSLVFISTCGSRVRRRF
jgi:hypothetical protein